MKQSIRQELIDVSSAFNAIQMHAELLEAPEGEVEKDDKRHVKIILEASKQGQESLKQLGMRLRDELGEKFTQREG